MMQGEEDKKTCPNCGRLTSQLYICTRPGCENSKKPGCRQCRFTYYFSGVRCNECKSPADQVWPQE